MPSVYSKKQLEELWISAGGKRSAAPVAAAVALAESSGRPGAENHNTDGSIDRGLWQINTVHGSQSTFNVAANAKAAVAISNNGTNWSPWTTYKTGAYKAYLSSSSIHAEQAKKLEEKGIHTQGETIPGEGIVGSPIESAKELFGVTKSATGFFDAIQKFPEILKDILNFVTIISTPEGWLRIIKVAGGGVIVIIALNELAKAGSGSGGTNTIIQTAQDGVSTVTTPATNVAKGAVTQQATNTARDALIAAGLLVVEPIK